MSDPEPVSIVSFSFRRGLPPEAQLTMDVRFLRNPFYIPELKEQTGQDEGAGEYIAGDPAFAPFFVALCQLASQVAHSFAQQSKPLVIAIGCTGGKHRSVYVAERLAKDLTRRGLSVRLQHRDMEEHSS